MSLKIAPKARQGDRGAPRLAECSDAAALMLIPFTGILRPNAPIAVQLLIGVYCIFWIALICADVLRHDRSPRQGMQTFHLVVFIPLSLAGWLQVYGTICAIPVRSAMINEGQRKPVYRSLSTRVIESHHLRNLMLLVIPSLYILLLMVPAILTGTYQKRSFASADRVVAGLDRAIADGGWSSLQALAECGREALELESNYKTLQRYVRWCCCVVMVWVLLDLAMYACVDVRARTPYSADSRR